MNLSILRTFKVSLLMQGACLVNKRHWFRTFVLHCYLKFEFE